MWETRHSQLEHVLILGVRTHGFSVQSATIGDADHTVIISISHKKKAQLSKELDGHDRFNLEVAHSREVSGMMRSGSDHPTHLFPSSM